MLTPEFIIVLCIGNFITLFLIFYLLITLYVYDYAAQRLISSSYSKLVNAEFTRRLLFSSAYAGVRGCRIVTPVFLIVLCIGNFITLFLIFTYLLITLLDVLSGPGIRGDSCDRSRD